MQLLNMLEIYPAILAHDFLRYFIAASVAYLVFWVFFKKQWQHRIIQQKPLQAKKMWMEFGYSMSTVFIFSLVGFGILFLKQAGHTKIYHNIADYGWAYFVGSIVLMIVLHDAYFYWAHRLMHHPKLFKHVHLVHHQSTNPSPWAAYSFHPIEALVEAGIFPLIVFTIPAHGLALLSFLIYMISRNVLGHLGIEWLPKWFIHNKWINWHTSTTHHDMHHKHFHCNYGLYFTWWDRWFGTEDARYVEKFEEVTSRSSEQLKKNKARTKSLLSKLGIFILFLSLITLSSCYREELKSIGAYQTFELSSDYTGQNYDIEVLLPSSSAQSDQLYPVVYLLDGKIAFQNTASEIVRLYQEQKIPEVILVGQTYPDIETRWRDYYFPAFSESEGNAPLFKKFLEEELIPLINERYPVVTTKQTLVGGSASAYFAIYEMLDPNGNRLFDNYLAASPYLAYAQGYLFELESNYAQLDLNLPVNLYMSVGSLEDLTMNVSFDEFTDRLASRNYDQLHFKYERLDGESHLSMPLRAYTLGLEYLLN